MRPIITFLFLCLLSLSLNAQLIEVPILGNPVLEAHHAQNLSIDFRGGTTISTTFLPEGGMTEVCVDTLALNLGGSFGTISCTNCDSANFGVASLSGLCIAYTSNMGNDQVADDVCLEICSDAGECDLYTYTFETRSAFPLTSNTPFFDDFSYAGPFPDASLWLDRDVFVNNTLANNPPSVGFATFDGIDETGSPYGGGYGLSDQLTSNFIDLSSFSPGSTVYLSFHVQEKGFGIGPLTGDTLVVEAKLQDGTWSTIEVIEPGGGSTTPEGFLPFSRELIDVNFFHAGFQLRFKNYSRRQGAIELWHVDYVAVSATPTLNGLYDDIAFTNIPTSFLSRYSSIPWRHFENNVTEETGDNYIVNIANHFSNENDVQNTKFNITEITTGIEVADFVLLDGSEFNIPSNQTLEFNKTIPSSILSSLQSNLQSNFPGATNLTFETTYAYNVGNEQDGADGLMRNDTVRRLTHFADYFAHDDGSAEAALVAPNAGDRIAVQFHANVADSLRGVQFHFPRIQDGTSTQLLNVQVYVGELDNEPEYNLIFQTPFFVDTVFDSLQGFTNYGLLDFDGNPTPVFIPEGDFYVGWQQVTNSMDAIPVGLDKNNLAASQYGFYSSASEWTPIGPGGLVDGAIMVRALLGDVPTFNTPVNEVANSLETISIYPNPTADFLNVTNLSKPNLDYQIVDAKGSIIKKGILEGTINTAELLNGVYFLQINDDAKGMISKRFVVIQ